MAPTYDCSGEGSRIYFFIAEWHAPPEGSGNEISVTRECERQFCNVRPSARWIGRFLLSVNPSICRLDKVDLF